MLKNKRESQNENERAVSPVIGVILMVAITVILAAVIATFVLDLGSNQSSNINAGVDFSESGDEVTTELINSGNADNIYVRIQESNGQTAYLNPNGDLEGKKEDANSWRVGNSASINTADLGTNDDVTAGSNLDSANNADNFADWDTSTTVEIDRITVIGELNGDEQVIQDWS